MRILMTCRFGRHLYGTSTPASDLDYKTVFVPAGRDIVMQRAPSTISNRRQKLFGEKNVAGDIDEELHSLQKFLFLAADGQTMAMDMLFAPDWAMVYAPSREWCEVMENRHRFVTRRSARFVDYVRDQANKYGIKGSRVATSRGALALIDRAIATHGQKARLEVVADEIAAFIITHEHTSVVPIANPATGVTMLHWDVCNKQLAYRASLETVRGPVQRSVNEYGRRALMAETQQGIDWKALSHAVRIGTQAIEMLSTGHITFPLPNAAHILDIKLGKLPYREVADEIEGFLAKVEDAATTSSLPDEPDHEWIEEFVHRIYLKEILG